MTTHHHPNRPRTRRFSVGITLSLLLLTSCATTHETTSTVEHHRVETMLDRMDSLLHTHTVVQQDSTWRETILRQFQSIRERSDTSRYVVADSVGNILRERIVINNTREVTSETDRQELQVMSHRLQEMDSTINIMRRQLTHSDSLLQQRDREVVKTISTPLSWWQRTRLWIANLVLLSLLLLALFKLIKKKLLQ